MNAAPWPDAGTLATIASVIVAFTVPMLFFRIQRELAMQKAGEVNWIPWADWLLVAANFVSLLLVILPLVAIPPTWQLYQVVPSTACGAAAILVAGYLPAILAHYRLIFRRGRDGLYENPEPAERSIVAIASIAAVFGAAWGVWIRIP